MDYNQIYNQTTNYFKEGKHVKKKKYVKINMMEYKNETINLIDLFDHIGEGKLFNFIVKHCFDNKVDYYFHHDKSAQDIALRLKIAPPTQFKYLALLVKKTLLLREAGKRGYYKVNPRFVS
jgi:hypothetical protein